MCELRKDGQTEGWANVWVERLMDELRKGRTGCLRWGGFELIDLGSDRRRVATGTRKESLVDIIKTQRTFDPTRTDSLGLSAK